MKKYLFVFFYTELCVCRRTLVYKNNPVSKTIDVVKSAKKVVAFGHYNPAFNFYLDKPVKKFAADQIDSLNSLTSGTIILSCSTNFQSTPFLRFQIACT